MSHCQQGGVVTHCLQGGVVSCRVVLCHTACRVVLCHTACRVVLCPAGWCCVQQGGVVSHCLQGGVVSHCQQRGVVSCRVVLCPAGWCCVLQGGVVSHCLQGSVVSCRVVLCPDTLPAAWCCCLMAGLDPCRGDDMLENCDESLPLLAGDDGRQGSKAVVDTHMYCHILHPLCWCLPSQPLCQLCHRQTTNTYVWGTSAGGAERDRSIALTTESPIKTLVAFLRRDGPARGCEVV